MKHMASLLALAAFISIGAQAAEKPVALVVDVSGNTTPAVAPYSEIAQGTTLELGKDGRIAFSHYETCKDVEVVGGTVTFDDFEYVAEGGKVTETGEGCPQVISKDTKVAAAGIAGGVVFRAAPKADGKALKAQNTLVLVGAKSKDVARVKIERNGTAAVDWAPEQTGGRAFQVPAQVLKDDIAYSVVVYDWDGNEIMRQPYSVGGGISLIRVQ